jgi:BirA family biotin operon repressor/biotin-[acetyl-CoA-carboxylase] ligase
MPNADPLDARAIAAALGALAPRAEVRVVARCGSTNSVLLEEAPTAKDRIAVLLAEEQTAGRGRRGRRWYGARGGSIALSLRRAMKIAVRDAPGLSLVAGVAAVRALGAPGVALKWPNDLVVDGRKLGGILVETRANGTRLTAVIGIGLNYRASAALRARFGRRIASLEELLDPLASRNALAARLVAGLIEALDAFEAEGLPAFLGDWEALDAHAGRRLRVRLADGRVLAGVAEGLTGEGALRLRTRAGVRAVSSGRVVSARTA